MFTVILACSLNITSYAAYAPNYDEDYPIAEVTLGKSYTLKNVKKIYWEAGNYGQKLVRDGRECVRLNKTGGKTLYIYVDVDDSIIYAPEDHRVGVEVDYFDEGYGKFTITYDGLTGKFTDGEIVQLENTGRWKTHTFYLENAEFANGFVATGGSWDFRIGEWSERMGITNEDVILGAIRVSRGYYEHTVDIEAKTKNTGNVFDSGEEKSFGIYMENKTKTQQTCETEYEVTDINEKIVDRGKLNTVLLNGKEKTRLTLKLKDFINGVYVLKLKTAQTAHGGGKTEYEIEQDFSVMDKFKKGDRLNDRIGTSGHTSWGYDVNGSMELLTAAGMGTWRDEYGWDTVEKSKNNYTISALHDKNINVMYDAGVYPLIIASYGNSLYDAYKSVPHTDEGIEAYAKYAGFLAEKYKDKIKAIEIWNEYNIKAFNPDLLSAEHYVKMLKACYREIKRVNPEMKVVGIVASGFDKEFLKNVFDAGGYDYMDAVSVHPYWVYTENFETQNWARAVQGIKDVMSGYGEPKELWLTEIGWPTVPRGESAPVHYYTLEQQGRYMPRMYMTHIANGFGGRIYIYDFQNDGTNPKNMEHNFGIVSAGANVRTPLAAKPALVTLCAMNKFIGNSEYTDGIYFNEHTSAYRFTDKDSGEQVIAIWSAVKDSAAINLGAKEITVLDHYGNTVDVFKSENGVYQFDLNDEQYYIKGRFTAFSQAEPDIKIECPSEAVKGNTFVIDFMDNKKRDLKTEIECDEAFETEENNNIISGRGSVRIKTLKDDGRKHTVRVKIYDGEDAVMCANYEISIIPQMNSELTLETYQKSPKRQRIVSVLKNRTENENLSGSCEIIAPKELAEQTEKTEFFNIGPGDSASVPINLPEQFVSQSRNITVRYELENGASWETTKRISETVATRTKTPPIIDGVLERTEWNGTMFEAKSKESAVGTWNGEKDLSFTGRLMYDSENLYVSVKTEDDVFVHAPINKDVWKGDSMQFAICDFSEKEGERDTKKFTNIAVAMLNDGPIVLRWGSCYDLPLGKIENAEASVKRVGTTTVYEIKLPWAEVFKPGYLLDTNKVMGFSLMVNDADAETRKGWMEYNSGIGSGSDSDLFGALKFAE